MTQAVSSSTTVAFSSEATLRYRRRGMSVQQLGQFASLIEDAEESGESAKEFLQGLTADELEILRLANCLADSINVDKISEEGAANLLRPFDDHVDLNDDGVVEIGIGKVFEFPPPNAPDAVHDAWDAMSEDMTPSEKMLASFQFFARHFLANMHVSADGSVRVSEPGDPDWVNVFDADCDYRRLCADMIEELDGMRKYMTTEQYESRRNLLIAFDEALRDQRA